MQNFITAFFMAWGNFLAIPCPYKKWDSKLNNLMLAMLPAVGLVVGALWFLLAVVLRLVHIPYLLQGFVLTTYIFGVSGFMHMDGFMDCADAIMSRRDREERLRILKDPNRGAFALIAAIMMVLGMFVFATIYVKNISMAVELVPLILIPVISRGKAGDDVLTHKPIEISQYAATHQKNNKGFRIIMIIQIAVIIAVLLIWKSPVYVDVLLIVAVVAVIIAAVISGRLARKNLGGMNGDIAGAEICWAELISTGTIALILYFIAGSGA